jgi:hypothetical protein
LLSFSAAGISTSDRVTAPAFVPTGGAAAGTAAAEGGAAGKKKNSKKPKKKPEGGAQQHQPAGRANLNDKAAAALSVLGAKGGAKGLPAAAKGKGGRGGARGGGGTRGGRSKARHADRWWKTLEDVDPISMEPLSGLRYPPVQVNSL